MYFQLLKHTRRMIINKKLVLIVSILMLCAWQINGQIRIKDVNFNHLYQPDALSGDVICIKQDTTAYLLLQLVSPSDSIRNYSFSYTLINSIDEEITEYYKLNQLSHYYQYEDENGSQYGLKINIGDHKYIGFWLTDTLTKTTYPFLAQVDKDNGFALTEGKLNRTIFEHYKEIGSTVRFNDQVIKEDSILVDFYDYHFLPAKPPMSQTIDSLRIPLVVDTSYTISTKDTFMLQNKGLYNFHYKGIEYGYSIMVRDGFYPKFTSIDDLIESLRYISTEIEYEKMSTSFHKKELLDEFWLNNTKSADKARMVIMKYYKRIREANIFFSSFREGWKTDRGMIYTIFGPPSGVFYINNGVMWVYNKTFELPRISFSFNWVELEDMRQGYILERKPEYENLWFRTVSLWRTGKKE